MPNNKQVQKERPLHDALVRRERDITDKIARFAGDMRFVYVHIVFFVFWIVGNSLMATPFDPYPFIFLTLVVSLEAIFLSTFVLINQNKDTIRSDRRASLDLAVDKRSEKQIAELKNSIEELKIMIKK